MTPEQQEGASKRASRRSMNQHWQLQLKFKHTWQLLLCTSPTILQPRGLLLSRTNPASGMRNQAQNIPGTCQGWYLRSTENEDRLPSASTLLQETLKV